MRWDKLEVVKHEGVLPFDEAFVREANQVTAAAFGYPVPLQETYDHLAESNLGHFVYIEEDEERKLIAYALNYLFEVEVGNQTLRVNYFSSAFILTGFRRDLLLYKWLGRLRLMQNEDIILVRTQSPIVISFFTWLCELARMRLVSHLDDTVVPDGVMAALQHKFGDTTMIWPGVYGRCLTGEPVEPKTPLAQQLSSKIDVTAGDAIILVGIH